MSLMGGLYENLGSTGYGSSGASMASAALRAAGYKHKGYRDSQSIEYIGDVGANQTMGNALIGAVSTLGAKFGPSLVNRFSGPSDSSIRQGWYQSDAGDPDSIYNNPSSNINYSSGKLINDPFGNDSVYGGTTTEWNTSMPAEIYTPNTSQGIFSSDNIMNIFNRGKTTFR